MTRTERKKLAKAARELASLYAEGSGPQLDNSTFCACAIGQVMYGGEKARWLSDNDRAAYNLDIATDSILTEATAHELGNGDLGRVPGAVVFPLMWLADYLESAR